MSKFIELSGTKVMRVTVTGPLPGCADAGRLVARPQHPSGSGDESACPVALRSRALLADVAKLKGVDSRQALAFSELGQRVCAAMEALPIPVVAAIDGMALGGGCELTLACDLVYASDRSRFGQIEVLGGILPAFGGTWRLPHRIAPMKALELLLTGATLNATKAKTAGLVVEVLPAAELAAHVDTLAELLSAGAPLAIRALKRLAIANRDQTLAASNLLERQIFASLFGTADQAERMSAFLEKRKPAFKGE